MRKLKARSSLAETKRHSDWLIALLTCVQEPLPFVRFLMFLHLGFYSFTSSRDAAKCYLAMLEIYGPVEMGLLKGKHSKIYIHKAEAPFLETGEQRSRTVKRLWDLYV